MIGTNYKKKALAANFWKNLTNLSNNYLLLNPHTHSFYEGTIRQGKVNRFPYVVVYEVFDHNIIIYSIFIAKQDPAKKRLK
jgi:hypothetical protein